ncbi:hypothetical protein Pla108_38000 [Botrimarina colliarenosi]|uniref:Uncharacterized protein n=1 Tax=Botrimarina colliarenosi TaxID=2528001 RepID=A0A5C6A485_9BACT|nr:hypothetical protein [Botrimarina colliarenosi]TWT94088.1 hypothetical protein Pla108_38000 [Botrimarina colliarenosi]
MRYPLLIAALASCGLFTSSSANAYWWTGAGVGIGDLYRSLDYPTDRRVPYFAAHPPVYYSTPVPRTYGHSPFAYTPDTRTPEVASPCAQPLEIVNPYVPSSTGENAPAARGAKTIRNRTISHGESRPSEGVQVEAVGPLMIINPYVAAPSSKTI